MGYFYVCQDHQKFPGNFFAVEKILSSSLLVYKHLRWLMSSLLSVVSFLYPHKVLCKVSDSHAVKTAFVDMKMMRRLRNRKLAPEKKELWVCFEIKKLFVAEFICGHQIRYEAIQNSLFQLPRIYIAYSKNAKQILHDNWNAR